MEGPLLNCLQFCGSGFKSFYLVSGSGPRLEKLSFSNYWNLKIIQYKIKQSLKNINKNKSSSTNVYDNFPNDNFLYKPTAWSGKLIQIRPDRFR